MPMILHMAEYSEENQIFRGLLSDYTPQMGYPDFAFILSVATQVVWRNFSG